MKTTLESAYPLHVEKTSQTDDQRIKLSVLVDGIVDFYDNQDVKDIFNGSVPADDLQFLSWVDHPLLPIYMNAVLGTKFKIVTGYKDSAEALLAMERGEIQGNANWSWSSVLSSHPDWVEEKKIRVLMHMGLKDIAGRPDIPSVLTLTRNDEQKHIFEFLMYNSSLGRPFFIAPGVPQDRMTALQNAFVETMRDKDFLEEAKRAKLEIDPLSGAEVRDIVLRAYAFPKDIVEKARVASQP